MKLNLFLDRRTACNLGTAAAVILASTSLAVSAATTTAASTAAKTTAAASKTTTTTSKTTAAAVVTPAKLAFLSGGVSSYILNSDAGAITENVPVTFGAVFAKGDVPSQFSVLAKDAAGAPLPTQVDVKARHADGSLRHAVVTVVVPHLTAGKDFPILLSRDAPVPTAPLALTDLPASFDATVTLSMKDGRKLTASAKALLAAAKPEAWLAGPQVTEWWAAGPLRDAQGRADDRMSVRFGIRSYGKGRPVRVEVNVDNSWMWVNGQRTEFFDAKITANGKTVHNQPGMAQQARTRWRKTFWWSDSSDVFVKQDLNYLKKARVIPNYNPKSSVTESTLAAYYKAFLATDRRPLETGIVTHYMAQTGGRGDIGPFPKWALYYLLTMDRRAYEMLLTSGDLSGSYTSHYRNEKTGRPATTEEFPNVSTNSNYMGKKGNLEIPDDGGQKFNIIPEAGHEPSLAFLPYLVTGDRYYLEELQFWSQWNSWGTSPSNHGYGKGLLNWDQIRAQGWSLRTLAQAAFITPDSDPMKATLGRELTANLDFYNTTYSYNSSANVFHAAFYRSAPKQYVAPWMDDFLTWATGYTAQLGFDSAAPFAKWKGHYPVQRMTNPDYCWILASAFHMYHERPDQSIITTWREAHQLTLEEAKKLDVNIATLRCASAEMGKALKLPTGKMITYNNPAGYVANMKPALAAAVDYGTPGAQAAWNKFVATGNPIDPMWDIVPWQE